ncbi:hypothetical protein N9L19_01325 [bacterium]|nr:hypothetical protein [bacterium]
MKRLFGGTRVLVTVDLVTVDLVTVDLVLVTVTVDLALALVAVGQQLITPFLTWARARPQIWHLIECDIPQTN